MLARRLPATSRAYSFFSGKPGGGRFFNSVKPPKLANPPNSNTKVPAQTVTKVPGVDVSNPISPEEPSAPSPSHKPSLTLESEHPERAPPYTPEYHPKPALPILHLHNFFSLHRPLLLLPNPVANLFNPITVSDNQVADGFEDQDADADVARVLGRAIVLQRVRSNVEWSDVLERLGLETEINMDSVKRKRRKKITKHK
jgi:hypothetical protein